MARRIVHVCIFLLIVALAYGLLRYKRDGVDDFVVYRTAGARAAVAADLYRDEDGHYQYKYLPLFAFVMIPFAWLPLEVATAIWFVITAWLVWLFIGIAARLLPDRRLATGTLIGITMFFTAKFWGLELIHGQTNVLLGLLVLGAISATLQARPAMAGALVAAAVFVKPYALVLLPWLVIGPGVTAIISFAVALVIGLLLPAVAYGWTGNLIALQEWVRGVSTTTGPNLMTRENISFAAFWAKHLGIGSTAAVLALVCVALTGGAALATVALRRRVATPDYLDVGLLLVLVPLISPQGWDYVLVLGIPAVMLLVDRFPTQPVVWNVVFVLAIAMTNFMLFDVYRRTIYELFSVAGIMTIGAVALVTAIIGLRVRAQA